MALSKSENPRLANFLLLFLVVPTVSIALLKAATLIPYVGVLIQFLLPFVVFFVYFFIGVYGGERASNETEPAKKRLLLGYTFLICTMTFASPFIIGYYTYPVKVVQNISAVNHKSVTYTQASEIIKNELNDKIGYSGMIAFAIYTERLQLTSDNFGEYCGQQFEDVDDLGGIISAVINIILHAIPMLLKWLLCTKLGFVSEAGFVVLTFWYLFSMLLSYFGWKSES